MPHDLQLKVMLSAEEYVAMRAICDEAGQSQSGYARQLIKRAIAEYAQSSRASRPEATDEPVQE